MCSHLSMKMKSGPVTYMYLEHSLLYDDSFVETLCNFVKVNRLFHIFPIKLSFIYKLL